MDYAALKTLIETHPSWPGVDDDTLTAWVNEKVISDDKTTLPATTILSTILNNESEWTALTDADKAIVRDILYISSGDGVPTAPGAPIRAMLVAKLGTNTKAELADEITELVSRAESVGIIGTVSVGDVTHARMNF